MEFFFFITGILLFGFLCLHQDVVKKKKDYDYDR